MESIELVVEVISNAVGEVDLDWEIISNADVVIWDWKVILDVTAVDDVWLNITWSSWLKIKPNISPNDAEIVVMIKIK